MRHRSPWRNHLQTQRRHAREPMKVNRSATSLRVIYFAHDQSTGIVHIGTARIGRLVGRVTEQGYKESEIINKIEPVYAGAEGWMHWYFRRFRISGEYFNYTPEMLVADAVLPSRYNPLNDLF